MFHACLDHSGLQPFHILTCEVNFEQHEESEDVEVENIPIPEDREEQEPPAQLQHVSPTLSIVRSAHSVQNELDFHVQPDPGFSPTARFLPQVNAHKSPLYEPGSPWQFESSHEAQLFLHFVQRLSTWVRCPEMLRMMHQED